MEKAQYCSLRFDEKNDSVEFHQQANHNWVQLRPFTVKKTSLATNRIKANIIEKNFKRIHPCIWPPDQFEDLRANEI